ncbi:MAG: hypothetical protein Tsb009_11300 [Planctomycetaceae bacterium]
MIDVNWKPSRREMKTFSLLFILFFGLVAYWVYGWTNSTTAAYTTFAVAAVVGGVGFFLPDWMRYVYVVWMAAVLPIGWVISHVMLAVIFYGVVTPIGLIMRACGKDPMNRRFDKNAKTYWIKRETQPKPEQYFRQF